MKYQVGQTGRVIVVRFEDRDDVLGNIVSISKKEDIRAGVFYTVGGLRKGRIVVGPENDENASKAGVASAWR
ncbi:MAG: hypothetical protein L0956_09670, partial [Candidatus Mariimomonas ferrooxydans]